MNKEEIRNIAMKVINRVLEESAFIFTDILEKGDYPDVRSWDAEGVSIEFKGEKSGVFHMWGDKNFYVCAAANMLGIDSDEPNAKKKGIDALKEILNIIVGNFITEAYGTEPIFQLALPEKLDGELLIEDSANENAIWLEAEENPILFVTRLKD